MRDGKTPLELALEREVKGELTHGCIECEFCQIVRGTAYCGISGKLLHPMMLEGSIRCKKREEARNMGLTGADLARMGPAAQRQIMEKLGMQNKAAVAANKYHNEPATVNGIHFDSKKEASRYVELMSLQQAGKIRGLKLQAQYTLQESYLTDTGERVRAIRYVADFAYERATAPDQTGAVHWLPVVEDVKSEATRTDKYKIKAKLFRERYGFGITEV